MASTITTQQGTCETKRDKKKRNAAILASQYSSTKKIIDTMVACVYSIFGAILAFKILSSIRTLDSFFTLCIAATLAMIVADLLSGLLHWGCDTWGTLDTPLIGKNLIRSFREHHVDPMAITRHPFPETNGNSLIVMLPLVVSLSFCRIDPAAAQPFLITFLSVLALFVSFTNQIHKWAHTYQPPWIVTKLQNCHIILESKNHNYHHFSPYDRDYCITTGWLNPVFQQFELWKKMEVAITKYTGAKPREDDRLWTEQDNQ